MALSCVGKIGVEGDQVASRPKVEQVVVAFKTHFDIGYTDLARNVVDHYRTSMIDKALDVCEASRGRGNGSAHFVWTLPGWPMAQILWPGQTAERCRRLHEAIAAEQLAWHALPASLHTESLDLEDIVRGLRFSSELSRRYGIALPRDAKMTDVPSHCWMLPTLLKHAGIDFLHIGCNEASASPDVPPLFWWEGPDGSRLLTMYTAGNYGTGLHAPDGWPAKTWLALIHTSDNHGPPAPDELQKLSEEAQKTLPGVRVRFGRLSDFADAILQENPPLPVIRADMPDSWIYGIASMPRETAIARRVRPKIGSLESLGTLLELWGADGSKLQSTIDEAYEKSLMFGEHTWGICMIDTIRWHYGEDWRRAHANGQHALVEESWAEKGNNIREVVRLVEPALDAKMAALARAVQVEGPRIVVFNPLPWTRNSVVDAVGGDSETSAIRTGQWKDAATGDLVDVEYADGATPKFIAKNVPPLGYRTYVPLADAERANVSCKSDGYFLENEFFRATIDPSRGTLSSLIDKSLNRELVDADAEHGFGQYLYERFDADLDRAYLEAYCKTQPWPDWAEQFGKPDLPPAGQSPYSVASPHDFSCSIRRGPVSSEAVMRFGANQDVPHDVRMTISLWNGCPYVDVQLAVEGKSADPWPEAGWLCFPLKIENPSFRLARLGVVIDPAKDICPGANHEMFCLSGGMSVSEPDGFGVGLCPLDAPLVSLGRPGLMRYTKRWTPRKPRVYVNLFNNVWGTNFQQWIGDVPPSTVRIWTAGADASELVRMSWEARQSCFACYADEEKGDSPHLCEAPFGPFRRAPTEGWSGTVPFLPPVQSGVELSRGGVLLTAFGPNPDGDGILLRLWEQVGSEEPCRVGLPKALHGAVAQPCNLRGELVGEPLPIRQGELVLPMRRYAPASVILK